ncbi:MAG: hypothetical protein ABFR05_11565 [Bacteroidota bacterium]
MKLIKYVLIGMAILGIIASIYNMIDDKSLSDVKTVIIGIITIAVALNIEKILDSLKSKESR